MKELHDRCSRDEDKEFLVGCKGHIFNVGTNPDMYGEGAGYNVFVGKDSSVALAKMKFDQ